MIAEKKQEFIDLVRSQPAREWRTLNYDKGIPYKEYSSCAIVWVGNYLFDVFGVCDRVRDTFGFTVENMEKMFFLNDESDSAKEAHDRIVDYVEEL